MPSKEAMLAPMVRKLALRSAIDEDDKAAILALPFVRRAVDPSTYLVREGEPPTRCSFLAAGYAYRQKLTSEGARQIVSIQIPGDFIDLQNLFLGVSDHNLQTLTRASVVDIAVPALRELVLSRPAIGRAMWIDALVDASIFREWIVNVGRRDARTRIAHILCEFALRLKAAELGDSERYELPMTQEQLADAVGLTPVHVNRVLKALSDEGLIQREKRSIRVRDWDKLRSVGDFSERYLHLHADEAREEFGFPGTLTA